MKGSTITKLEGQGLPARMRAIVQRSFGGPEVLQLSEVDRPALDIRRCSCASTRPG
jgi:hypothetical protein